MIKEQRTARDEFQTNILDAMEDVAAARRQVENMGLKGEEAMLLLSMIGTAKSALDALRVLA